MSTADNIEKFIQRIRHAQHIVGTDDAAMASIHDMVMGKPGENWTEGEFYLAWQGALLLDAPTEAY